MSARLPWHREYHFDYLSRSSIRKLSWKARGVWATLSHLLWCETDSPGLFMRNGKPLNREDIHILVVSYGPPTGRKRPNRDLAAAITELEEGDLLRQLSDGTWIAPTIFDQEEFSKLQRHRATSGKRGARNSAQPPAAPVAKPRAEQNTPEQSTATENGGAADGSEGVEDSTVGAFVVEQLSAVPGVSLHANDRAQIRAACEGKTRAQVTAVLPDLKVQIASGNVRSVGAYAAKLLRAAPEPPPDRSAANTLQRARKVCNDLDVPWEQYGADAMRIVAEHGSRIVKAVDSVWREHKDGALANGHGVFWQRFVEIVEETPFPTNTDTVLSHAPPSESGDRVSGETQDPKSHGTPGGSAEYAARHS